MTTKSILCFYALLDNAENEKKVLFFRGARYVEQIEFNTKIGNRFYNKMFINKFNQDTLLFSQTDIKKIALENYPFSTIKEIKEISISEFEKQELEFFNQLITENE